MTFSKSRSRGERTPMWAEKAKYARVAVGKSTCEPHQGALKCVRRLFVQDINTPDERDSLRGIA